MGKIVKFRVEDLRKEATEFLLKNGEQIKEATNGGIAKYMMAPVEDGGLGMARQRGTIYRRLRSGNSEFTIEVKKNEKISYDEKVRLAHEYLKREKFSSGDKVTKEDLQKMSEYTGFSPRQVAIKILKIDEGTVTSLMKGDIETASIKINSKYDDLSLQDKMKNAKKIFEERAEIRLYSYDEIKQISEELQIPEKLIVTGILNKDAKAYETLKRGEVSSVYYEGPIPEYENPEKPIYVGVLTPEDMQESIFEKQEFYEEQLEGCKSREDLEIAIAETNQYLEEKREGMVRKYTGLYGELLKQYKSDEIVNSLDFNDRKQYYSEHQKSYMLEINEILKRNPKYGTKISVEEIERISKDFGFDPSKFYSTISKNEGYSNNILYNGAEYKILQPKKNIRLPKRFQEIMYPEMKKVTRNIARRLTVSNDLDIFRQEDMQSLFMVSMIGYGGNVIFNEKEPKSMDENINMLGGYVRRIGNYKILEMINDRKELGMQTRSKKGEEIPEDHDRRFQDYSKDTEMQAISNARNSNDVVKEEQCVELANFDLEMLEILIDEENTTYLEALAQKLNIDKEELRKKAEALANELGGR